MKTSRTVVTAIAAAAVALTVAACGGDGGSASDDGATTQPAGSTESPADETPAETPEETPAETPVETATETSPDDTEGGAGGASGDYCALIADADTRFGSIGMEDVTDADAQGMADALAAIRDAAPSDLTDDWNVMYVLMQSAVDEVDPNSIEPGIMDNYESASTNVETSISEDCGITM